MIGHITIVWKKQKSKTCLNKTKLIKILFNTKEMTNEEILEFKTFLAKLYAELFSDPSLEKRVQTLAMIIDTKVESNNLEVQNAKNSLYLDIKYFISVYLRNKRKKNYGYEDYNRDLLLEYVLSPFLSVEQQYRLLVYLKYLLETLSYETAWLSNKIFEKKLKIAKKNKSIKYLLLLSSRNLWTILISILSLYFIECIILLPAPLSCMEWYTFQKVFISSNAFINHLANVITLHFDCIDNSAKISFTTLGLVSLVLWNVVYVVVGVNFLFKNLFASFNVDELEK